MQNHVLLIENDLVFIEKIKSCIAGSMHLVEAQTFCQARQLMQGTPFDLIFINPFLNNTQDGLDGICEIRKRTEKVPIIALSDQSNVSYIRQAFQAGATDYILKSAVFFPQEWMHRILIAQAREAIQKPFSLPVTPSYFSSQDDCGLIGNNVLIQDLRKKIHTLGPSDVNIMIYGETGTGKELVAKALHRVHDQEKKRPFVSLNCAAISKELMESELFGHVKGAFTGATQDKKGLIECADGGDFFLDELGELPLELQAKFLRVLQEGEFKKVGCTKTRFSQFRIIAATNSNLSTLIEKNAFRSDLFYRITGVPIRTPSLLERLDDIPLLVHWFLQNKNLDMSMEKKAMEYLMYQVEWPGNVRQLKNHVEVGALFARQRHSKVIKEEDLKAAECEPVFKKAVEQPLFEITAKGLEAHIKKQEALFFVNAMKTFQWNIPVICEHLEMSRTTLYEKLSRLSIKKNSCF